VRWSFATTVLAPRGGRAAPPDAAERARVLRWAAEAGFEGVEVNPRWYDVLGLPDAALRAFAAEVIEAGLCVSGLNLNRGILTRTPDAARHLAEAERAIEVAAALGGEVVNLSLAMPTLPGPGRPPLRGRDVPDEEHERSAELVAGLGERAGRAKVAIALDLHDDGLLDTPELCLQLLRRVGRPNVGINPDLGNVCRGPGPVPDWRAALRRLAPFARNWHVKNYRAFQPAPVWDGDIDYAVAVAAMRAAGYRGWVSIESYYGDVLDLQRRGLDYLRHLASAPSGVAP
jgi:sugar phosphate isomerase/epimerase